MFYNSNMRNIDVMFLSACLYDVKVQDYHPLSQSMWHIYARKTKTTELKTQFIILHERFCHITCRHENMSVLYDGEYFWWAGDQTTELLISG